jgi:2'-5' RNA ligase
MHRLFVALRPPQPIRDRLLALMGGVRGARWLCDEQIHLTLRFIGEVDRHLARDIDAALASVHHPRFDIALSGLGAFERRGGGATLWAGVAPQQPLKALHKKVDQACLRVGVEPDRRAYAPHITLARLKPGAGPIQPLLESEGGVTSAPFPVEEFCLYESQLTLAGPVYSAIERYRLA